MHYDYQLPRKDFVLSEKKKIERSAIFLYMHEDITSN